MYAGWQKDATTDPALIEQYFSDSERNIGLVCGERFDAWDIEVEHVGVFIEWLSNRPDTLPEAALASTGRGGMHILTKPTGVDGTRYLYLDGKHIGELKSRGGFILVCPSFTEQLYTWSYLPDRLELPEAPDWLRGLLERPVTARKMLKTRLATPDDVVAVLGRLAGSVEFSGEGSRNNYLYWAMRRAIEEGVPAAQAKFVLTNAGVRAGLAKHEVDQTIEISPRRRKRRGVTALSEDLKVARDDLAKQLQNGSWTPPPGDALTDCEFLKVGFRSWGLESPDKDWRLVLSRLDFGSKDPSALLTVFAPNHVNAFGDLDWFVFSHAVGVNGGTNFNQCVKRLNTTLGGAEMDWSRRIVYLIGLARQANAGANNGTFSTMAFQRIEEQPPFVFNGRIREGRTMSIFGPGSAGKTTLVDGLIASAVRVTRSSRAGPHPDRTPRSSSTGMRVARRSRSGSTRSATPIRSNSRPPTTTSGWPGRCTTWQMRLVATSSPTGSNWSSSARSAGRSAITATTSTPRSTSCTRFSVRSGRPTS